MSTEPIPSAATADAETAPNPLGKISAISLFVEDVTEAKSFYRDVFDVKVLFEDEMSCAVKFDNLIVNLLQAAEGATLVKPAAVGSADAGKRFQLSIWVDDLEAVIKTLVSKEVRLLTGPQLQPWGMKTVTFTDPAGHSWEVGQNVGKSNNS